jgi:hypothetical protein
MTEIKECRWLDRRLDGIRAERRESGWSAAANQKLTALSGPREWLAGSGLSGINFADYQQLEDAVFAALDASPDQEPLVYDCAIHDALRAHTL